jgi:hypothetical protein
VASPKGMEVGEALRRGEAMWEGMEGDAHALREDKGAGRGSGVQAWGWGAEDQRCGQEVEC